MEQQKINHAVCLFQNRFGQTPQESNYPVISIYEKQHAYLYAETKEAVVAYKTCQNILRWIMRFYLWPIALAVAVLFVGAFKFQNLTHPMVLGAFVFFVCWVIVFFVLCYKVLKADKKQKDKVIWLNY